MSTSYPIRFANQMHEHLRSLRRKHGLTQAQLGALAGVSQARIAEIEAKPGLVNFDQMLQLLSLLGASLSLDVADELAQAQQAPSATEAAPPKRSANIRNARGAATVAAETPSVVRGPNLRKKRGSW